LARTPEFDHDQVLESALQAFWEKGYEATSLSDLLEATGLARQSLYNTFGDKRGLFLASLRRYTDVGVGCLSQALEGGPVRAAIRGVFDDVLQSAGRDRGCFLVNASTELLPRDAEVGRLVASALARQERALAEALRRGVRQGELQLTPKRIEQTARFLVGALQGLHVMVKAMPDSPALRDVVAVALRAID
jgi:TetR/AcrR family transcriptional regulator, transcriptional repressor for nem operon